ncbi:MAG: sigma-54-dependent Fis family transcriptional regulator [Deltaproteobacteria bacterium]|nr:sigma-54-dependent Fis family transcriptional regulator [Deltaproteobacteria bacterium]
MKQTRFRISLHIIIPIIFAGFASLAAILVFRVIQYAIRHGLDSTWPIFWSVIIIVTSALISGLLVTRLILRPVEKFVKRAQELPAMVTPSPNVGSDQGTPRDDMEHFTQVFEQVTDVLSKVEAQQHFPKIIGQDRNIRGVFNQILRVAPTDSTVLISGDSGTGKELVATSIYEHSLRKDKPFIKLNCVAIPEGLLESELFGHEKGAFTGANGKKLGKFEMANGGTIFLDEIADMPLTTQAKILRALQEKEFERVGGTDSIKVDVRFIAATNKDITRMVKEGEFREDLYYRLNVISIYLPPLRERKRDIPLLVDHFLKNAPKPAQVSSGALELLMAYSWPGNVRELQNTIERAAVMSDGLIQPSHVPPHIVGDLESQMVMPSLSEGVSLNVRLREIEKGMMIQALRKTRGVQARAAELLGLTQRSMWHKVRKHNIDVQSFKNDKTR